MRNEYLDAAELGKNDWWRYLLGTAFILFLTFIVGSLPLGLAIVLVVADGSAATGVHPETGMLLGISELVSFPLLMFSFVALLAGVVIAVPLFHRRPARSLVTPGHRIRWGRALQGALVWMALAALISLVEALVWPDRYQWALDLGRWLPFAALAALLIPIQTSAEELAFRGYLGQGLGRLTRNPWLLSAASGLLFALPHFFNPEVAVNFWVVMGFYFVFGAGMMWFTLRDNGLELALGVHAGNNLFTALLANFEGSALQTPAIFQASGFDPWYGLVSTLAALIVFYLIVFGLRR
jgi:membrane protease YdiL (CAAX protease family)